MSCSKLILFTSFLISILFAEKVIGEDWLQFMGNSAHTGDGSSVELALPLGLVSQIKLEDAVLSSPIVVGDRVYVVDQMGTAYAIDYNAGKILWKISPDGAKAMGSNTSSPCLIKDILIYGTTSGNLHYIDTKTGKVISSIDLGSPIISAITSVNENVYFQALDGIVRSFDSKGNSRWKWDHYKDFTEATEVTKASESARGHPGSYGMPHYGGGEVTVSGNSIVTSIGWDIFCLTDKGASAELTWCRRCPSGRDGAAPMSSSISEEIVYTAGMGADGVLGLMRFSLKDGTTVGGVGSIPYPWNTLAVRGAMVVTRGEYDRRDSISTFDCTTKKSFGLWSHPISATPVAGSQVFTKDHCVIVTLNGEVIVSELLPKAGNKPFVFTTPNKLGISGAPAIANGRIFFGSDDGNFYVLGSGGALSFKKDEVISVYERKAKVSSPTGNFYAWNSGRANGGNTGFVDDPKLVAPLRLKWAVRGFGHFKTPCVATAEGDIINVTLDRTVTCLEQETGRLRWRRRLPPESAAFGSSSGLFVEAGRLYVPCPNGRPKSEIYCLNIKDGATEWSAAIGGTGIWDRNAPVFAAGKIAFGFVKSGDAEPSIIQAWDAITGKEAWRVTLDITPPTAAGGCTDGKTMFFSAGREEWGWKPEGVRKRGEIVAVDASNGKVIWKSNDFFASGSMGVSGTNLIIQEYPMALRCISTIDGKEIWNGGRCSLTRLSIGPDYVVMRGYGGGADKRSLKDGSSYPGLEKNGNLGGLAHACGEVALSSSGNAFAVSVAGLSVRDVVTGKLLWQSPGFAPRACVNASISNGRIFFPAAANGMVYCWEPEKIK